MYGAEDTTLRHRCLSRVAGREFTPIIDPKEVPKVGLEDKTVGAGKDFFEF